MNAGLGEKCTHLVIVGHFLTASARSLIGSQQCLRWLCCREPGGEGRAAGHPQRVLSVTGTSSPSTRRAPGVGSRRVLSFCRVAR